MGKSSPLCLVFGAQGAALFKRGVMVGRLQNRRFLILPVFRGTVGGHPPSQRLRRD